MAILGGLSIYSASLAFRLKRHGRSRSTFSPASIWVISLLDMVLKLNEGGSSHRSQPNLCSHTVSSPDSIEVDVFASFLKPISWKERQPTESLTALY